MLAASTGLLWLALTIGVVCMGIAIGRTVYSSIKRAKMAKPDPAASK